ncbi:MAG: 4-alpha-glucanotransferase, partial [Thermomicrobiales bacterium]|nr:4-alpha-glucanotransferase [Thermomicrobiales bacterium]
AIDTALGPVPIVVEDLGIITPDVAQLRNQLGFQGMKVLQFAFDGNPDNAYLPHNYIADCVVYPGTHDNQTAIGWFHSLDESTRQQVQTYLGTDGSDISWDFIRLAFASVADLAIVPLQDVMRLGDEARMNRPGVAFGNWKWRYQSHQLHDGLARGLRELSGVYGRLSRPPLEQRYDPFDYSAPDTAHPLYDRDDPIETV